MWCHWLALVQANLYLTGILYVLLQMCPHITTCYLVQHLTSRQLHVQVLLCTIRVFFWSDTVAIIFLALVLCGYYLRVVFIVLESSRCHSWIRYKQAIQQCTKFMLLHSWAKGTWKAEIRKRNGNGRIFSYICIYMCVCVCVCVCVYRLYVFCMSKDTVF